MSVSVAEDYNLQRHHTTKHLSFEEMYEAGSEVHEESVRLD